ncbi:hypothetical protein [Pseudosporangium ferrugineum]|uniref:Uncharacterized protein n=1 Tax=Pseudosporangium ferrugineum TaxID=439699 RepID=A0A2T0SHP2_9ACTN|nr:hypothetical protein [Pseudosporangium ferrugineum]PRY32907.1 hypothetical protein CLV70_10166 [Pseudosporangium ferrugineum]
MSELSTGTTGSTSAVAVSAAAVSALISGPGPRLRPIANQCSASSCPTVYLDADSGTLVIQGYDVPRGQEGVDVPEGESLVRVPIELLVEAMTSLT